MATPNERKALLFLAIVALSGSGVRVWRDLRPASDKPEESPIEAQMAAIETARSKRHDKDSKATKRPSEKEKLAIAQKIDIDRASAVEIELLPGVGPALAGRIVHHRDSAGPFGSLDALCAVKGIGPGMVRKLAPVVTFSAPPRPVTSRCGAASRKRTSK